MAALLGCVQTVQVAGPRLRYPVSLTDAVLGPAHEVIEASRLERLHTFRLTCNSCECADREGIVDISDAVNQAVAANRGEAVISFDASVTQIEPAGPSFGPTTSIPFLSGLALRDRCQQVEVRGVVVRRRVEALRDHELERRCADGVQEDCEVLTRRYVARHDEGTARAVLSAACERHPELCARAPEAPSPGVARDDGPALALARRWCEAGSPRACWWAGELLTREGSRLRDDTEGRGRYVTACDGGVAEGCASLGELTLRAGGDRAVVVSLFRRACDADVARACAALGRLTAGTADARRYFERACALGDASGCIANMAPQRP